MTLTVTSCPAKRENHEKMQTQFLGAQLGQRSPAGMFTLHLSVLMCLAGGKLACLET